MRSEKRIKPFMNHLIKEWEKSPDQRFGQFLINQGLVADDVKTWHAEISDYPLSHEVMREIQTWGTYGKDRKEKMKDVFIKDLETDHIEAIIKTQSHISKELKTVLEDELIFRKTKEKKK